MADYTAATGTVLGQVLDMAVQLDEDNIPEEGRFIVLSPAQISMLKQPLESGYLTGDGTNLRNGVGISIVSCLSVKPSL